MFEKAIMRRKNTSTPWFIDLATMTGAFLKANRMTVKIPLNVL